MKKLIGIVSILLIAMSHSVSAQSPLGEIRGKIKADSVGFLRPLPSATIALFRRNVFMDTCISDNEGNCVFKNLEPDSAYEIRIDRKEFDEVTITGLWVYADLITFYNEAIPVFKGQKKDDKKKI